METWLFLRRAENLRHGFGVGEVTVALLKMSPFRRWGLSKGQSAGLCGSRELRHPLETESQTSQSCIWPQHNGVGLMRPKIHDELPGPACTDEVKGDSGRQHGDECERGKIGGKLAIRDKDFCDSLARLKRIRFFLNREAITLAQADIDALKLGQLWVLYFDPHGRMPIEQEWEQLDRQVRLAFSHLSPDRRDLFMMTEIPPLVIYLLLFFLAASCLCLLLPAVFGTVAWLTTLMSACYIFWSCCLGGLGSLAFVAMNALSVQRDITFDLTNVRLVSLRTVVGSMFAVVLSLPFGYQVFFNFCLNLLYPTNQQFDSGLFQQALWLFAPFAFGFSTSFVIILLNQIIRGVQSFLGFDRKTT